MATTALGQLLTAPFPTSGGPLAPGTTPTSGGVFVDVAAGATVTINDLVYDTPDKQGFRTVSTSAGAGFPFLDVFGVRRTP